MKKQKKGLAMTLIVAVLVVSAIAVAAQSGMLQGKFPPVVTPGSGLYHWHGQTVSIVTSPVTSVITTPVTSPSGTSQVPSTVTTPVASPVIIPLEQAQNVNIQKLPKLTMTLLTQAAKDDFKKNPGKYKLSKTERQRLINLFLNSRKK